MLISRGVAAFRAARLLKNGNFNAPNRNSSQWAYRSTLKTYRPAEVIAEVAQGVVWWWVLWHLWTEPGHVFGEFEYPDPLQWTDEELGIPSD